MDEHLPAQVVERQLVAYNARDLQMWAGTYAEDAQQVLADGTVLATGRAEIEARMPARFADAALHATLLRRIEIGEAVIDYERVTRTGASGRESLEMCCVYVVRCGYIARATFVFGIASPESAKQMSSRISRDSGS